MDVITESFISSFEGADSLRRFIEKNEFVRVCQCGHQKNMRRFLETGRSNFCSKTVEVLPMPIGYDHPYLFSQRRGGYKCIVSQPYIGVEVLKRELPAWAEKCGLAVEVYETGRSFYSPGNTSMYIFHLPEFKVVKPLLVWEYISGKGVTYH